MKAGAAAVSILFLVVAALRVSPAQTPAADEAGIARAARMLFEGARWHELLGRFPVRARDPAELNYYRGVALARLERWREARLELEAGRRKSPTDKRFPIELAGVAFRENAHPVALALIREALRLDPADRYANDFAATIHLLQGSPRAALRFWERIGKPAIEEIRSNPEPSLDPVLLDRAFKLRPVSVAKLRDYDATLLRLKYLDVFQSGDLELVPAQDERFDLVFRNVPRAGLNSRPRLPSLLTLVSGAPFATVYPEAVNIRQTAVNVSSLARWDAPKRRIGVSLSGPLGADPGRRLRFDLDARDEDWDLSGAAGPGHAGTRSFAMKRIGAAATLGVAAGTWVIETGAAVARRDFDVPPEDIGNTSMRDGLSLKYTLGIRGNLYSAPHRGLEVEGDSSLYSGVLLGSGHDRFAGFTAGVHPRWYPAARRVGYALSGSIRAGMISSRAPFDEFYSFGLERDNDLVMRGHGGTRDGRKGRGPLGTRYFLASCQFEQTLSGTGLWRVSAGPFLDTGYMHDANGVFGSRRWLYDVGLQLTVTVLNAVGVTVSFGKDLRSGRNAFFADTSRRRK